MPAVVAALILLVILSVLVNTVVSSVQEVAGRQVADVVGVVLMLGPIAGMGWWAWKRGQRRQSLGDLGSADWTRTPQALAAAEKSDGAPVRLGLVPLKPQKKNPDAKDWRPLVWRTQKHVLLIGGTRGGKGTTYLVPHLLTHEGGLFVLDPKGENVRATYRRRAQLGPVAVLDPFDVSGFPSALWNPLQGLGGVTLSTEAAALAAAMVAPKPGDRDSHWTENGRELLRMLILHVCTGYREEARDLVTVRRLLSGKFLPSYDGAGNRAGDSTLEQMAENKECDGLISDWATGFLGTYHEEQSGVVSTARTGTQFLDDPRIRRLVVASPLSVNLSAWLQGEALAVFICLPAPQFKPFAGWLRLCTQAALDTMTARHQPPPLPVAFVLDELAQLGRLQAVESALTLGAGYGVQLWSVFQDWGQVTGTYHDAAASFWTNSSPRLVFAVTDPASCKLASDALGVSTVITQGTQSGQQQQNLGFGGGSSSGQSQQAQQRPLLHPDEVAKHYAAQRPSGAGWGLVFLDGLRPVEVWRQPYFEDPYYNGAWDDPRKPPTLPAPQLDQAAAETPEASAAIAPRFTEWTGAGAPSSIQTGYYPPPPAEPAESDRVQP